MATIASELQRYSPEDVRPKLISYARLCIRISQADVLLDKVENQGFKQDVCELFRKQRNTEQAVLKDFFAFLKQNHSSLYAQLNELLGPANTNSLSPAASDSSGVEEKSLKSLLDKVSGFVDSYAMLHKMLTENSAKGLFLGRDNAANPSLSALAGSNSNLPDAAPEPSSRASACAVVLGTAGSSIKSEKGDKKEAKR